MGLQGVDIEELLLRHLAPGAGCVIAFLMFFSPFKAVMGVRSSRLLGDLNPLPLVAIIANCTGWLLYGCITGDPYVIAANEPGLLLGLFMALSCYGFADQRVRDLMLRTLMFFAVVLSSVGIVMAVFIHDQPMRVTVSGYTAVSILLCYYAAPLSTMAEVLRTRSSASLYWPTCAMNTVNGLLWLAYGMALEDLFIAVPNAIGAAFGVSQLLLIRVFPAKRQAAAAGVDGQEPLLTEDRHVA